ncbi:hypothetical protein DM860_002088 [Cuscuta australis]|uniref:Uncharacterized protein n=2 Tax=Cuscuta sect. Cleistogrammica TaxID=1824901 RepID=A0A328DVQ1_9ASTE|nr:hypothetical protein DM860_002088 [Cuscuta australis]
MERKRTLKLSWDELEGGEEDDDQFFDPRDRLSCAVPLDLATFNSQEEDDDDDEFEDSRLSLSSTCLEMEENNHHHHHHQEAPQSIMGEDYRMWMADPGDIKERRKRLLQGMGLASSRIVRAISREPSRLPPPKPSASSSKNDSNKPEKDMPRQETLNPPSDDTPPPQGKEKGREVGTTTEFVPIVLVRSRSDGDIEYSSVETKRRKEELIGPISKQRLTRTSSGLRTYRTAGISNLAAGPVIVAAQPKKWKTRRRAQASATDECFGSFFLIKNLYTGKEFIVKECNENGMWNKLSDLQTGKQLTMEEFEKHVGHSRLVKELMHRGRRDNKMVNMNSYISKSFRYSKKTSVALMKNIKGVANSMSFKVMNEKDHMDEKKQQKKNSSSSSSEWIKVQQQGKSHKEFTGLQLCQEIQAHDGAIWTIKFSNDARFLASAGEDRVIHIWEIQEVEVVRPPPPPEERGGAATPLHPSLLAGKGKSASTKRDSVIPEYVSMPETVFAFSEKPVCTLNGHQDEVLDLSWSKSQLLLSSSMDKTVRLWDVENQSCLKMFAHNDYVTCIQFNPENDDYFVSGSLDAKVRLWNVPGRKVVDWTDQKNMVTAIAYTPDGEGVIIGLQKGSCRLYRITDCKLEQEEQVDIDQKKKSQNKKITGFEFSKSNPSELLITSADSYIRIHDGTNFTQKFKGFKITSSQISGSLSQDGKYVISASEDSQVYVWKREEVKSSVGGKPRCITVQAHEHFPCKDVSVAISWPGRMTRNEPQPPPQMHLPKPTAAALPPPHPTTKRSALPPLPKKNGGATGEPADQEDDDDTDENSSSNQPLDKNMASPAPSRSSSSVNLPEESGGATQQGGNATVQATAWGMVIVTASSGGEIRVYQNFGLPVKANRQTSLFIT